MQMTSPHDAEHDTGMSARSVAEDPTANIDTSHFAIPFLNIDGHIEGRI